MTGHINVEFKARYDDLEKARTLVLASGGVYHGRDHQIDTYFPTSAGRLKIRRGNLENSVIFYHRSDEQDSRVSSIDLLKLSKEELTHLESILAKSIGRKVVVDKKRDIYFADNVKIHLDVVDQLGKFIEVEAIDHQGLIGKERLRDQCEAYRILLGIKKEDIVPISYSDMILNLT